MEQDALRLIIRGKLTQGDLPHDGISRFWGALANGELCDACEEPIRSTQVVVEGISEPTNQGLQLHVECFAIWDEERDDPARRRSIEEQYKFKDKWDNMVSVPCPLGDHIAARVPIPRVEGKTELVGVVCQRGECGHRFNWEVQRAR